MGIGDIHPFATCPIDWSGIHDSPKGFVFKA